MIGVKGILVLVVSTFLWTMTLAGGGGSKPDVDVTCVFMESCILPCNYEGGVKEDMLWMKDEGYILVIEYNYTRSSKHPPASQQYINRTSLFEDQISKGNASLLLTGVDVQDEGKYTCAIRIIGEGGYLHSKVNLKVEAPVGAVDIEQVGNRIICSSERIYPEPEITWSTSPSSNVTFNTTVQKTDQQLYNISSSLVLSDSVSGLVYSCNVSTHTNWRNATFCPPPCPNKAAGVSHSVVGVLLIVAAAAAAAA